MSEGERSGGGVRVSVEADGACDYFMVTRLTAGQMTDHP